MKIKVLNKEGKETGKSVDLSDEVFAIEPNQHVVWLDVKHYLANQRQGTHKSKERAEVSRSTKKLVRQKVLEEQDTVQLNLLLMLVVVLYSVHVQEITTSN